jgi:glyoxylase-like metal-dependent hydrolase (beta-lactamase superfamily II)/rhodanese-related sulfurtransferase
MNPDLTQDVGSLQVTPLPHPQGCRGYVIVDPASKEAVVVDAHLDQAMEVAALVSNNEWNVRWLVDTHTHADHPSASAPLHKQLGATRVAHAKSKHVGVTHHPDDQEPLAIGDESVVVRFAPGHTPDHIALVGSGAVFSGDSLFIQSVARADFLGGDPGELYDSLQNVLLSLPDETLLYPGHDYENRIRSSIGAERSDNPWLQLGDRDKFVAAISSNKPAEPANMAALLKLNIEGVAIPAAITAAETVRLVEEGAAGSIVDVRELEEIEAAHIPGSRHIVLNEIMQRADEIRATPAPRLILCAHGVRAQMAAQALHGLGIGGLSVIQGGLADYMAVGGSVAGGNLEAATGGGGCCAAAPPSAE